MFKRHRSPRLHLFDQKYRKNSNIVKNDYSVKRFLFEYIL